MRPRARPTCWSPARGRRAARAPDRRRRRARRRRPRPTSTGRVAPARGPSPASCGPNSGGSSWSRRRAAAGASSSGYRTPRVMASTPMAGSSSRAVMPATRRARRTSAAPGSAQRTAAAGSSPVHSSSATCSNERWRDSSATSQPAVADAVLVEAGDGGDDLHIDRWPRFDRGPATTSGQGVEVLDGVEGRPPVGRHPPSEQPAADVGVQRRPLDTEAARRLRSADELGHPGSVDLDQR